MEEEMYLWLQALTLVRKWDLCFVNIYQIGYEVVVSNTLHFLVALQVTP